MECEFTHRLDTIRTGGRLKNVKISWRLLAKFFLLRGDKLSLKYFPGDVKNEGDLCTAFGIAKLEKYVITKCGTSDHTIQITCPLILEVSNIVLDKNFNPNLICPCWDLEVINKEGRTIFYSHDWGSGTLLELTQKDLEILLEQGIDQTYLNTPAFVSADCTRIINGVPQLE